MTSTPHTGGSAPTPPDSGETPLRFARVSPTNREAAATALVRASSGRDPRAGKRFLQSAKLHGIDLTHFWAAFPAGRPTDVRHACLIIPGAGATGMVFVSRPETPEEVSGVSGLLDVSVGGLSGVRLAQALLTPDEGALIPALLAARFQRIADLLYLRRPWRAPNWESIDSQDASRWPEGVRVVEIEAMPAADLAAALEASYVETADCPELHGLRRIEDVIESHRGTGRYDPSLWWGVYEHGRPAGALLLNQCPDLDHCELVYLGLAPTLRGLGMGRRLLRMGIGALERRAHRALTCAVDARNAPARSLYESEGFEVTTSRTAYVRSLVENM